MKVLEWKAVIVGRERPRSFNCAFHQTSTNGWISEPEPKYPMDIVIRLHRKSQLHKLEISFRDCQIPRAIHVKVGNVKRADCHRSGYERAKFAKYTDSDELKFEEFCSVGEYLWLVVDSPSRNSLENPLNKLHIVDLKIYGTELNSIYLSRFGGHFPSSSGSSSAVLVGSSTSDSESSSDNNSSNNIAIKSKRLRSFVGLVKHQRAQKH